MKKNIGTTDRVVRALIGVALLAFVFFTDNQYIRSALVLGALFTSYEALVGWCALYALLGRNTCPVNFNEIDKNNEIKK